MKRQPSRRRHATRPAVRAVPTIVRRTVARIARGIGRFVRRAAPILRRVARR